MCVVEINNWDIYGSRFSIRKKKEERKIIYYYDTEDDVLML